MLWKRGCVLGLQLCGLSLEGCGLVNITTVNVWWHAYLCSRNTRTRLSIAKIIGYNLETVQDRRQVSINH